MQQLKEYIVTAKSYNELDDLCNDIESPGGNFYIPNRAVTVANTRPVSRNTHYYLSDDEAESLRHDPRVESVILLPEELGIKVIPHYTQTSINWDKSNIEFRNSHRNWGLYRCTIPQNITNWGSDGNLAVSGGINILATGKDVDVVIMDGHVDPSHPEFSVNEDGTGGSRVIQYNWYQNNLDVNGSPAGNYIYPPYVDVSDAGRTDDNNHGCHVAGTACGNTQGWARDAKIYNINPYSTNVNSGQSPVQLVDYVKVFHRKKAINPRTGKKNPTIVNMSFGFGLSWPLALVSSINYRGVNYAGPFTASQAWGYGVPIVKDTFTNIDYIYIPTRYSPIDADIADAIAEGVIFVGAAGNQYAKVTTTLDIDYYNFLTFIDSNGTEYSFNYHRGPSPSAATDVVCVGAMGATTNQQKTNFSNTGPRIDIWAPGENIMSSVNNTDEGTYDYRNDNYFIEKYNGTSMASPQVAGVLACVLEVNPTWNQYSANEYITKTAKLNQVGEDTSSTLYSNLKFLQGAPNRFLYFRQENQDIGMIFPKLNVGVQKSSGQLYPRQRIYSYGTQIQD